MEHRKIERDYLERLKSDLVFEKQHWVLLVAAVLVGCIGLNLNAMPMILGAKLLSPLMPSIIGIGVGLSYVDLSLIRRSCWLVFIQVVVAVLLAVFYFCLSPLKLAGSELESQVAPTIGNVLVAFIGGIVGAIGVRRTEVHHLAVGVALATSLVPPLCAAGYGIATGQLAYVKGSLYLFGINVFFILLGHYLVSQAFKQTGKRCTLTYAVYVIVMGLSLLLAIPAKVATDKRMVEENIRLFVEHQLPEQSVLSQRFDDEKKELRLIVIGPKLTAADVQEIVYRQKEYGLEELKVVVQQVSTFEGGETDID